MITIKKRFVLILVGTFIFAWMQGGNLPYSFFYSLVIACFISIFQTTVIYNSLDIGIKFDKKTYSTGEEGTFTTVIKNSSLFPVTCLEIKNIMLSQLEERYKGESIYLKLNDINRIKNKVKFRTRGVYNFGITDININDMLYICKRKKQIKDTVEIKVYPKLYNIHQALFNGSDVFGNVINNNKNVNEDLTTVRDVRKYVSGDNLKKIHWKLSAKQGELYVRNFDTTASEECIVFVNMNEEYKNMENWKLAEEGLVDFTASLISYMNEREIKSEVFINGCENQNFTIRKRADFNELMEFFLCNKSNGKMDFIKFISFNLKYIERFSWIGIITTKLDRNFRENLIKVKDLGYNITVFYYENKLYEDEEVQLLKRLGIECINYNEILIKSQK